MIPFILIIIGTVVVFYISNRSFTNKSDFDNENDNNLSSKQWWEKRRTRFNVGLIVAGFFSFVLYVILGATLIMPYDEEFEITLFTTVFQGFGYLFMMLIANMFYNLGYYVDKNYNKTNSITFRKRLFNCGFWFSFALPFIIPFLIVIQYLVEFSRNK